MKKIFIVAAVCALSIGCSQTEKLPVNNPLEGRRDIRLTVGVDGLLTRAGHTGDNLDAFQLIIDNKDNADYRCNLRMQKTDGDWNAADGASLTWNPAAPEVTVYAVAPAMDGIVPAESIAIDIPSEQNSEDVLKSADFLLAKKHVDLAAAGGQIALTLEHKLSRLVISSSADVQNVKVNGVFLHGTCDLTAEAPLVAVAADAEVSSVTPLKNADGSYECILLPQSTSGMTITYSYAGSDYEFRFADALLEAGASYTVALKAVENRIIEIDRTGWTVTGKYEERRELPEWHNGIVQSLFSNLVDNDPATFWESDWSGGNAKDIPPVLVIDTKTVQSFSKIGLMNRNTDHDNDKHNYRLEFYVSTDERTWWDFDHAQAWSNLENKDAWSHEEWKTGTNWESQENWIKVGCCTMQSLNNPEIEYCDIDSSKSGRYFIIKFADRGKRGLAEFSEVYLYRTEDAVAE